MNMVVGTAAGARAAVTHTTTYDKYWCTENVGVMIEAR